MIIIWYMVLELWSTTDRIFVNLDLFLPFFPPNNLENQNCKKWKKYPEILLSYTGLPKMTSIWYMVPEIWSVTGRTFCYFRSFLPFYLSSNPKNQNFKKNEKTAWRYHYFTQVHQKSWSYAILSLKYGMWWM